LIALFLVLFTWPARPTHPVLQGTEIFKNPGMLSAVVLDDHLGFSVDKDGSRLISFDLVSLEMRHVALKGEGPRDLDRPIWIVQSDERVLVGDSRGVAVFSLEGSFMLRVRPPDGLRLLPAKGGWFGLRGLHFEDISSPLEAVVLDDEYQGETTVGSWPSEVSRGYRQKPAYPMRVDPTRGISLYRVSPDGRFGLVKPEGIDTISIFDLESKERNGTISLEGEALPFDDAWGEAELESMRGAFKEKGIAVRIVADFPDRFPAIRNFIVTAENRVVVALWRPRKIGRDRVIRAFDLQGRVLAVNELDRLWLNLIGLVDPWLVVWVYNPDLEEYTVGRCRRDELGALLDRYSLGE